MSLPFYVNGATCIRYVDSSGIINTLVGGFTNIDGIAVDSAGNVYFCDALACYVYKMDPSLTVTIIAGTGTSADSGVPGPALSASFISPGDIVVDAAGNLYFTTSNAVVCCLNMQATTQTILNVSIPSGHVAVVAGVPGNYGYSGDGGQATSAEIQVADALTYGCGIAVDSSGILYIYDGNFRVRKVLSSGIISTVAGNGTDEDSTGVGIGDGGLATSAELGAFCSIAVSNTGILYITDGQSTPNFDYGVRLRAVNLTATTQTVCGVSIGPGIIKSVAGTNFYGHSGDGGLATSAQIVAYVVGVDSSGVVFIGEYEEFENASAYIRTIDTSGIIETVAGIGTVGNAGDGSLASSAGIWIPWSIGLKPTTPPTTGLCTSSAPPVGNPYVG